MNTRFVRFFRLFTLVLSLAGLMLVASIAAAQEDSNELRSTADYVYGQSMRFNLSARNIGNIEAVRLFFRLGTSPDSYAVEVPVIPGWEVDATYAMDLKQTRLPPYGAITYWWELSMANGASVRVPEQVFSYVDDQFNWQQLSETDDQGGGSIRIHWTGEDMGLGEKARDITLAMLPEIGNLLPLGHILPFDIYIYPSTADLSAALRLAGRTYEPGQTYPELGVVLATVVNPQTADSELRQELSRGLVDLLTYQAVGQFAFRLPPWLLQGMIGVVRGEADTAQDTILRTAMADGNLLSVNNLCNQAAISNDLAEAQSEALVSYIVATYGPQAIGELILRYAEGDDCPTALRRTLDTTPELLDGAWRQSLRQSGQDTQSISIWVWLVLILVGFAFAMLLVLRPRRR